jgi:UDP:flavonoid glycosyltransferase YjiC (YdhE family)
MLRAREGRPEVNREDPQQTGGRRIVLATFGSFGDLHPYLAIARALQARGHVPVLATSNYYRAKIEALGLAFHAVRPDAPDLDADPGLARRAMEPRRGTEVVVRELVLPFVRQSYEDLTEAARGADLLVSHPLTFAVRSVAEKQGIPWASSLLAPMSFISAYDPPVPPARAWLEWLRPLGPGFHRLFFRLIRRLLRSWTRPLDELRAELGLPPVADPLFEGQHAPGLVLALFSHVLGRPQPDWPPQVRVTGFPFFDQDGAAPPAEGLTRFLAAGPPPVAFTLGTSAVLDAGTFYAESIRAVQRLGRRAVLLVGTRPGNLPPGPLPEGVFACAYAPFSELFPRCAAIVHQGGVGTTAQALRAGVPMLVVPFAHDQPDNAARVRRLGVARVVGRTSYRAGRVAAELRRLLEAPRYAERAAAAGKEVRAEDGATAAAEALEGLLRRGR